MNKVTVAAQRKAMGLCERCVRKAEVGRLCKRHAKAVRGYRKRQAVRRAELYRERKAAGVCVSCCTPVDGTSPKCGRCNGWWAAYKRAKRVEWAATGMCINCGGRRAAKHAHKCLRCLDREAERYEAAKSKPKGAT